MTFSRANAMGWGLFELLTSTQMNVIDSQLPLAVDGRGGAYTLQAPLGFDGSAVTTGPTFNLLSAAASQPAMRLVAGGNGQGIEVHSQDTTGHDWIVYIHGDDCNQPSPAEALYVVGRTNTAEDGGGGANINAGDTSAAGKNGGTGIYVRGGSSYTTGFAGRALQAQGGSSNFTDSTGVSKYGRSAIRADAGYTYGLDNSLHFGAAAAEFYGSQLLGAGKGGAGLIAFGGLGPSNTVNNSDAGPGAVGVGSTGVWGITSGSLVDYRPPPAEFLQGARAAVRATAQGQGRAILSELSGGSTDAEINYFKWVGPAAVGSGKTMLKIESATSSVPFGLSTGLIITSGLNAGQFRGATISGRAATALQLSTQPDGGGLNSYPPIQIISQSVIPDTLIAGGIFQSPANGIGGQSSPTLFFGSGSGTGYYDRIVGSADSAAAWAWARIRTNGSGGASVVAGYNVSGVRFNGTNSLWIDLNAITGGPADGDHLAATGTSNNSGGYGGSNKSGSIEVLTTDGVTLVASVWDYVAAGTVDLTTHIVDFTVMVHALPLYGRVASKPTYYRP